MAQSKALGNAFKLSRVVNVLDPAYGAKGDGVTNDTTAIQAALNVSTGVIGAGAIVFFPHGTYLYESLTFPDYCSIQGEGQRSSILKKRSNGALITLGNRSCVTDIGIDGDSKTGVCMHVPAAKDYVHLINVETRNCADNVVTFAANGGAEFLALGCALATSLTPGTGAALKIASGADSGATPRRLIACSGAGATLIDISGMNNVHLAECRTEGILAGAASALVSIISCRIGDNAGAIASITFNAVSTGLIIGNSFSPTVVLNDCQAVHFDNEVPAFNVTETGTKVNSLTIERTVYTPVWTGSGGNPAIGNGTITGIWRREGRQIHVQVRLTVGSTTTFGSGTYSFSMPFANNSGQNYVGVVRALDAGTDFRIGACIMTNASSTVELYFDNAAAAATPTVPFTWASGDTMELAIDFMIY